MADKKLDTQLRMQDAAKNTLGAVNSVIQRASSLVFDSVEAKNTRHVIAPMESCSMDGAER